MAKNPLNLEAILTSEVKKGDQEKAVAAIPRTVRKAKTSATVEISNLTNRVDDLQDAYDAAVKNPSSSLNTLVEAERDLVLAKADLEAAQAVFEARF
jgi:hypothetical protein